MSRPAVRLCLDGVGGSPAMDTAVSRAILERVDRGELPATLRLSRPPRVVAFSARDARNPGFDRAVRLARARGFDAIRRLAGGLAAVFTPATVAVALAEPAAEPTAGITDRFRRTAGHVRAALAACGVDARIGEVPGEYCPGDWSVNARGAVKIAGLGQRLLRNAAHTGGVVVVDDAADIRAVLGDVYPALGLDWVPATTGSVAAEAPGIGWEQVRDAIVDAVGADVDLVPWRLDAATVGLARRLAGEHEVATGPDAADHAPAVLPTSDAGAGG